MKALLDIPQEINQTLNIIKAQHNLKNKVEAITLVVTVYKNEHIEPELRPEYIEKLKKLEKEKGIPFRNIAELRKIIEG